jgi:hypothetical protein
VIVGHRAIELCVDVSHRADTFICRISKPPCAGEVLPKFSIDRLLLEDGGREWMYTDRVGRNHVTPEWIRKTDDFVEQAYGDAAKGASLVPCPCNKCANRKRKSKKSMVEHIWKNKFTPGYTMWIFHGEAHRTREVLRQRVEHYDVDAGVADMLNDYHEAQYARGCTDDEPEPKTNFKMHVWYQYSMHDLPTYGLFCALCVHGKFPCPVCKESLRFIWLKKGGKYSSFDKHRQFLHPDHPFRLGIKNFTKGVVVIDRPPATMTGAEIHQ